MKKISKILAIFALCCFASTAYAYKWNIDDDHLPSKAWNFFQAFDPGLMKTCL
ncbi:MAG: hypothetical protein HN978_20580 [Desulfobacula sp.]|nr:hypothetical protein [Desulfobacula sp.]